MPFWLARKAAPHPWKRGPRAKGWGASLWLANKGRERIEGNLTRREQTEFWNLLKKSKGRPGNLTPRNRTRTKTRVGKAVRGWSHLGSDRKMPDTAQSTIDKPPA